MILMVDGGATVVERFPGYCSGSSVEALRGGVADLRRGNRLYVSL